MDCAPKTILLCDDTSDIREALGEMLTLEGYNVVLARDAHECMAILETCTPDLILLDVRMPDHDGFWVAESIQDMHHRIPIIFITAYDRPLYRVYAPLAGAVYYLVKPVPPDVLLEKIEVALNRQTISNARLPSVS